MILAAVALVAALAAWQGAALGAITNTAATLEGAQSIQAPVGSVMTARVTAAVSVPGSWRATQSAFAKPGASYSLCVDHGNNGASRTFDVTAPPAPGDYDAIFTPNEADDCGGVTGDTATLTDGLRVPEPAENRDLPPRCGIDVMLVLDRSGSIGSTPGAETAVKDATRAFLNALSGTGAGVSIVDFSTDAARPIEYTTVTQQTIDNVFEPYLTNDYNPGGWTNWEAAFHEVYTANATSGTLADLVVFITDGDPTAHSNPTKPPTTNLTEGDVTAMVPAAHEADGVKGQGSHVFALGVGSAVTDPLSARRLTAVSGFDQFRTSGPSAPFSRADYSLVQDFDDLAAALRQIAIELCQASVSVTKLVDEGDGVFRSDPGWEFTATVSTSPGGYAWLQPPPPPATGPRSQTTKKDGVATFQWKPVNANATSTVSLEEQVKPGYEFVDLTCLTNAPGRTRTRTTRQTTPRVTGITVGPNEYVRCEAKNRIRPGTIEIEKSANPQGSQEFAFTGSLGPFTLVDQRANQRTTSETFTPLAPGQYTVRETVPDDWELTEVACSDPAVAIAGPQVTINLAPGDAVVCTYRDTRIDPPVPPEPPDPPPDPLPPSGGASEPPTPTPPTTRIRIVKTTAAAARVGQRVAFELTVTNAGPVAAQNVIVADVPPAALTLAGLQSTGASKARIVRGNAVWRLGTLAPGARRTVRGSVVIEAGSPGLKRNLALATAVNANLARDDTDTRVLAQVQRRIIPPVTG